MKKEYKARLPFGKETRLNLGIGTACPICEAPRGEHHKPGCYAEECPDCGGVLVLCPCMALSIADDYLIVRALAETMTREQVFRMNKKSAHLDRTYEEKAGFMWIMNNAPPELQQEMEEQALEIIGGERCGDMVHVTLEKAAEALGVSIEEARPIMDALEAQALYPEWDQHAVGEKN